MNDETKWLAPVYQDYIVPRGGQTCSTQVVQLSLRAASAQEAMDRANIWLRASGIEDAYVSQVCRDGLEEIVSKPDLSKEVMEIVSDTRKLAAELEEKKVK
jgi:hypothetical protein